MATAEQIVLDDRMRISLDQAEDGVFQLRSLVMELYKQGFTTESAALEATLVATEAAVVAAKAAL
jgi:hypothetical protein